ncbi:unnamed protein product [Cylicocyclus nassatus]|uniref:Uncharacterized protein n=1 Tax=Cylicocyclus nassatus TaxID=53992 RepID=A0AA36GNQ7_CYLNA|nr:unnamed protein product [Cylicocyclus nassatus]
MNLFLITFLLFSIRMTSGAACTGQTNKMCQDACVRRGHPSGRCRIRRGNSLRCICDPKGRN